MVNGFYAQKAQCEDQSSVWSTVPVESRATKATTRRPVCSTQDELPNSINGSEAVHSSSTTKARSAAASRRWLEHVNTQAPVSFDRLLWSSAEATQDSVPTKAVASRHGSRSDKSGKRRSNPVSPASTNKKDDSFFKRIAEWDLSTANTNLAAAGSPTPNAVEGKEDGDGSRTSSPALSASGESKHSSNSPDSPRLNVDEDVAVQADVAAVSTTTSSCGVIDSSTHSEASSVLLETLPESIAEAAAAEVQSPLANPSYITPCASFTNSPSSSATSPLCSPTPTFTMADIVAALRSCPTHQHPFLDMQYQRNVREHERVQEQMNQQIVHSFQTQFSGQQQAAAFKCLLNAAHRRQYAQCVQRDVAAEARAEAEAEAAGFFAGARSPSSAGRWGPRQRRLINRQWRMTAEQAECDLYREGLGSVQRKLSCMCLFNPDTDVRVYDENCNMREQRCYRQHKLLIRLQRQRVRGGNPYFLEETK